MRGPARCHDELRAYCGDTPLIDCHDHSRHCGPRHEDPLVALLTCYFKSDFWSASDDDTVNGVFDMNRPLEERWPAFERVWKRTCHTGYAQMVRRALRHFYGIETLTLDTVKALPGRWLDLQDEKVFDRILGEAKIAARLVNYSPEINVKAVLDGTLRLTPRARLTIRLPEYHRLTSCADVERNVFPLRRHVTSLDEYLAACRAIFEGHKRFGAVAFKDQSAYSRAIDYGNPCRADAERLFNSLLAYPNRTLAYPDQSRPLDDFLFHEFMRMARDMDLPVQIHTGHMDGIRNEIVKTNAVQLTSVFTVHRDVRFDLFHANWPFAGELLFLAKNYPNVSIDLCWTHIIDPVYSQTFLKQALSCVPHGKVHGYGTDLVGAPDLAWAHAEMARDNIAIALSDMVEMEYLGLDEAKAVARMWMFDNANAFYRLNVRT